MRKLKPFKELTIKNQKMRIVKDAIAQINAKKFIATNGKYLLLEGDSFRLANEAIQGSLQKLLPKTTCEVCAKGSLLASCVLETNKLNNEDWRNEDYQNTFLEKKLSKWFSQEELAFIEAAFELGIVGHTELDCFLIKPENYNDYSGFEDLGNFEESTYWLQDNKEYLLPETIKAIKFGRKYKNSTNRLLAILNNIIENGTFKP